MNCFSGKLYVKYSFSYECSISFWYSTWVIDAIKIAVRERKVKPYVIHTDRGCQYVCHDYKEITKGILPSYSKKAYPWDDACLESFHALIKRGWLNRYKIFDYNHAHRLVFQYINTFYNTVRIHSHCGYLSPDQYGSKPNCSFMRLVTKYSVLPSSSVNTILRRN